MKPKASLAPLILPFIAAPLFAASSLTGPIGRELIKMAGPLDTSVPDAGPAREVEPPAPPRGSAISVDLDRVDTHKGNGVRVSAEPVLSQYGIKVSASPGTSVNIIKNRDDYGGEVLDIPLSAGVLEHVGGDAKPIRFTLTFNPPVDAVRFARPALIAGESGIWFPEWSVHVLSGNAQVGAYSEGAGEGIRYFDLDHLQPDKRPRIEELCRRYSTLLCGIGNYPERRLEFVHENITSMTFDGDAHGRAAFGNAILWDIRIYRSK